MKPQLSPDTDALTNVAFNRAMAEHADTLKAFAARMLGDELAAEDVAQDAFLAFYRHLHQVPANAVRPWLFRVTRNLCLDQLRRRKFKLRLFRDIARDDDFDIAPAGDGSGNPAEEAHTQEARAAIEAAIQALPARFREAFVLCEVQGLSYEEAAGIMGCPVKTVSTRLFRARQRFRAAVANIIKV